MQVGAQLGAGGLDHRVRESVPHCPAGPGHSLWRRHYAKPSTSRLTATWMHVSRPLGTGTQAVALEERRAAECKGEHALLGCACFFQGAARTMHLFSLDNLPDTIVLLCCSPVRCCVAELVPHFSLNAPRTASCSFPWSIAQQHNVIVLGLNWYPCLLQPQHCQ